MAMDSAWEKGKKRDSRAIPTELLDWLNQRWHHPWAMRSRRKNGGVRGRDVAVGNLLKRGR